MKTIAKVILSVSAAGVIAFVAFGLSYKDDTQRCTHLAHVDWLPAEASDVTFAKSAGFGSFTCYECQMPKKIFDRLVLHEHWKPEPKSDVPNGLRQILELPALTKTEFGESDTVATALFYEKRQPNGSGITVIYDLKLNRLFVHESSR